MVAGTAHSMQCSYSTASNHIYRFDVACSVAAKLTASYLLWGHTVHMKHAKVVEQSFSHSLLFT